MCKIWKLQWKDSFFVWLDRLPCLQVQTPESVCHSVASTCDTCMVALCAGSDFRLVYLTVMYLTSMWNAAVSSTRIQTWTDRQAGLEDLDEVCRDRSFKDKIQSQATTAEINNQSLRLGPAPSPSPVLYLCNFGKLQVHGTGTGKKMLHRGGKTTSQKYQRSVSEIILKSNKYSVGFFRGLRSHCLSAQQQVSGEF